MSKTPEYRLFMHNAYHISRSKRNYDTIIYLPVICHCHIICRKCGIVVADYSRGFMFASPNNSSDESAG